MNKPLSQEQKHALRQILDSEDMDAIYALMNTLEYYSDHFPEHCFDEIIKNLNQATKDLRNLL